MRYEGGTFRETLTLDQLLERTRLASGIHANTGATPDLIPFQSLVPDVVDRARAFLSGRRAAFNAHHAPALAAHLANLQALETRQTEQLELDFPNFVVNRRERDKRERREREIRSAFDERVSWVKETMTVEDNPFVRIVALFTGEAR